MTGNETGTALLVEQVALTTLRVSDPASPMRALPVVGVWVDPEPLYASGVLVLNPTALDLLPTLMATGADPLPGGQTRLRLSGGPEQSPAWTVDLPAAYLAVIQRAPTGPSPTGLMLFAAPGPSRPDHTIVPLSEAVATVLLNERLVAPVVADLLGETLPEPGTARSGTRTAPAQPVSSSPPLSAAATSPDSVVAGPSDGFAGSSSGSLLDPTESGTAGHLAPEPKVSGLGRDQVWAATAGMALGETASLHSAAHLAAAMQSLPTATAHDPASEPDPAQRLRAQVFGEALRFCARLASQVAHTWHPVAPVPWPAAMGSLQAAASTISPTGLNTDALDALTSGHPFEEVCAAYGTATTTFTVMYAAAALVTTEHAAAEADDSLRSTTSLTLARWLSTPDTVPWWTLRATIRDLLAHDTTVLADVMEGAAFSEGDPVGSMAHRVLHTAAQALHQAEWTAQELTEQAAHLDIMVSGLTTVVAAAAALVNIPPGPGCHWCHGVDALAVSLGAWTTHQVAAQVWPVLADLDAQRAGHEVGEPSWRDHRMAYLSGWLGSLAPGSTPHA